MDEADLELRPELLDDFFAECDEQLAALRGALAALEHSIAAHEANPGALERLYRNLHSLKGNAAIVGLRAAEQLAHAAEGILRRLTRGEDTLHAGNFDVLSRVVARLEQMIASFRLRQPVGAADDLLAQMDQPVRTSPSEDVADASSGAEVAAPTSPPAPGSGAPLAHVIRWRAVFSPSAELDARGVNVNSVRARLAGIGQILQAAPVIKPGGRISFEFTLAVREVPTDLDAWEKDGVTLQAEAPAPSGPGEVEAPATTAPAALFTAPSHVVRVDLSRLDELMRIAGDMVIHRSRLQDRLAQLGEERPELQEVNVALGRSLRELRSALVRVRLVPIVEIFSRLPFVVRDLNRESGRNVRLTLEGQDTEVDKYLVERLKEPLLHLVRNAVSHGIESPEERATAGKPAEAMLVLRAEAVGEAVQIVIRDDGRGVNANRVAERARAAGLQVPDVLDEPALLQLICTPGFSTREEADRTSGRGVGMAVVASTVRDLGGTLSLATERGRFTQFTVRLPLTLSIADTFVVAAGPHLCAIPQGFVDEVVQVPSQDMRTINGTEVVPHRGSLVPLLRLRRWFALPRADATQITALLLATDRGPVALAVDAIRGQREVVVRPLQDPLLRVPGVSGATELGDGRPVLIVDVGTLGAAIGQSSSRRLPASLAHSA